MPTPAQTYTAALVRARAASAVDTLVGEAQKRMETALAEAASRILADVEAGAITAERGQRLLRRFTEELTRYIGQLEATTYAAVSAAVSGVASANEAASVKGLEAAGLDAAKVLGGLSGGVGFGYGFDGVNVRAMQFMASRGVLSGGFAFVARNKLQGLVPEIDAFLTGAVARGVSNVRAGKELAAILAGGDPAVLAALSRMGANGGRVRAALQEGQTEASAAAQAKARQLIDYGRMVAVTEINTALFEADRLSKVASPAVGAVRWQRSGRHKAVRGLYGACLCDAIAELDRYGLGKGVYPAETVPPHPHPRCACGLVSILRPVSAWDEPKGAPPEPRPAPTGYQVARVLERYSGTGQDGKPRPVSKAAVAAFRERFIQAERPAVVAVLGEGAYAKSHTAKKPGSGGALASDAPASAMASKADLDSAAAQAQAEAAAKAEEAAAALAAQVKAAEEALAAKAAKEAEELAAAAAAKAAEEKKAEEEAKAEAKAKADALAKGRALEKRVELAEARVNALAAQLYAAQTAGPNGTGDAAKLAVVAAQLRALGKLGRELLVFAKALGNSSPELTALRAALAARAVDVYEDAEAYSKTADASAEEAEKAAKILADAAAVAKAKAEELAAKKAKQAEAKAAMKASEAAALAKAKDGAKRAALLAARLEVLLTAQAKALKGGDPVALFDIAGKLNDLNGQAVKLLGELKALPDTPVKALQVKLGATDVAYETAAEAQDAADEAEKEAEELDAPDDDDGGQAEADALAAVLGIAEGKLQVLQAVAPVKITETAGAHPDHLEKLIKELGTYLDVAVSNAKALEGRKDLPAVKVRTSLLAIIQKIKAAQEEARKRLLAFQQTVKAAAAAPVSGPGFAALTAAAEALAAAALKTYNNARRAKTATARDTAKTQAQGQLVEAANLTAQLNAAGLTGAQAAAVKASIEKARDLARKAIQKADATDPAPEGETAAEKAIREEQLGHEKELVTLQAKYEAAVKRGKTETTVDGLQAVLDNLRTYYERATTLGYGSRPSYSAAAVVYDRVRVAVDALRAYGAKEYPHLAARLAALKSAGTGGVQTFGTSAEANPWLAQWHEDIDGMSATAQAGLRAYTGSAYADLNSRLRRGDPLTATQAKYVKGLDEAAKKSRVAPSDVLVHRGVRGDYVMGLVRKLRVGDRFEDAGYSSTSVLASVADNFAGSYGSEDIALFRITIKKGTAVIGLGTRSSVPSEAEILLPRGNRPRVTRIEKIEENAGYNSATKRTRYVIHAVLEP